MPHLRVALVSDWFLPRLGGIEIHLRDLANHLARAGHQVEVVTPLPGPTQVDNVHVRRVRTTLCPKLKVLCGPFGFARLARTLRQGRYDLLHIHLSIFSPTGWAAAYYARRYGLPAVVTFHSVLLKHATRALALADALCRWSRWPMVLTTVSDVAAHTFRRAYPNLPVHHLPNGIDPQQWAVERPDRSPRPITVVSAMRLARN